MPEIIHHTSTDVRMLPKPPAIMEALASVTQCHRGQEVVQADMAGSWYRVVAGAAIKFTLLPDGRRQILDFLLPGDFFGFNAENEHSLSVDAATEGTVVARYPRHRMEHMADNDPQVARLIREIASETISRLQVRALMLGQKSAAEKVACFLVAMAERSSGITAETIDLPMSRHDIADYLAISVETVSRAMTGLKHSGAIELPSARRVRILDPDALDPRRRQHSDRNSHAPAELREKPRPYSQVARKQAELHRKRQLANHAFALAQVAEKVEREGAPKPDRPKPDRKVKLSNLTLV